MKKIAFFTTLGIFLVLVIGIVLLHLFFFIFKIVLSIALGVVFILAILSIFYGLYLWILRKLPKRKKK